MKRFLQQRYEVKFQITLIIYNSMRIGLVSTSRSGSTYFRRYLCNTYNLMDSGSWLKTNPYSDIEKTEFIFGPHVLKVLLHYIPKPDRENVLNDFPKIWLYRDDEERQFLSHVTRLRTNIHHVYKKEERPEVEDNSLVATRKEFDRFKTKLKEFWDFYYKLGFTKNEPLIRFEDFANDPRSIMLILQDWFYEEFHGNFEREKLALPLKIEMDYSSKFINYSEIGEWFNE